MTSQDPCVQPGEGRTTLNGAEGTIFDLVSAGATAEEWAEWLLIPLKNAAAAGNFDLVMKLQTAGASGNAFLLAMKGDQQVLARELLRVGTDLTQSDEMDQTPLHLAASLGCDDMMPLILQQGAVVDALDSQRRTPFHLAATRRSFASVEVLLAAGADLSLRFGDEDESALETAAIYGDVDVMRAIVRHGVDVNARDSEGFTALHAAAENNQEGAIDVLIAAGADVNARGGGGKGKTPLYLASASGSLEAALALLRNGADVHELASYRRTALHVAAKRGHTDIVNALLDAGARLHLRTNKFSGDTPLDLAAKRGHVDTVQRLIRQGARLNDRDADGFTTLHKTASENEPDVIDALVASGAEVGACGTESGFTPLHVASIEECSEAACCLLKHGASMSTMDKSGQTALHLASDGNSCEIITTLLENGANANSLSGDGEAPLHVAAARGNVAVTLALLFADANVNLSVDEDGSSPLSIAALNGHTDVAEVLIRHGAYLGATDSEGSTALHQAASENHAGVIDVLVKAGASLEVLDKASRTPLVVAFNDFGRSPREDAQATIVALLKHGANPNVQTGGYPLLSCAAHADSLPVVEALLAAGAEVNAISNLTGCTALHVSTEHEHPGVLEELLRNAADTEIHAMRGQTPLHVAADGGYVHSIDFLIDGGAMVDVQDENGRTPLHVACSNLDCSAIHALLRSGSDIQAVDNSQWSPLHHAVSRIGHWDSVVDVADSVNLLLRWGADENAVNSHGKTAREAVQEFAAFPATFPADTTQVHHLLSKAPQDKTWRRRGWLVLCRTRPDRVRPKVKNEGAITTISSRKVRARDADAGSRSDAAATLQQGVEGAMVPRERDAPAAASLGNLVANVLGLREEDVFRSIVGFL